MTRRIVPLYRDDNGRSALARFDGTALELLADGRATTLSSARLDVILARLYEQRAVLVAVITDLQTRPSSGDAQIDALNADLRVEADKSLAQLDLFIQQAETCALVVSAEAPQP
ncbi:hypothetical protein [Methylobacterium radiotolerans]|uniref:hypothetical protein n=1 Tax=Methylobacterium radiotolerans TaxID=31998 RepID=UPI001F31175F|nr:hypothetical protein [Methylobacterium radiotolerans]UIY43517.1 hypothetical protein LZ599_07405 [Methylobacterium radiotolerans]